MKKLNYKMKKSVISEQTTSNLREKLEKFLSDGCVKNGVIVSMQSTNPLLQLAIKQESTRTPGKFRYVFSDNRIGSFNENGKFEFSPSKMSCRAVQQSAAATVTATQQSEIDSKIATEMKKGWKKLETLKDEGVDLTTLNQVFDIGNIGPESSIKRLAPMHSVSVGDVIVDETGRGVYVAPLGFKPLDVIAEHFATGNITLNAA
jgi:hypothetical protein